MSERNGKDELRSVVVVLRDELVGGEVVALVPDALPSAEDGESRRDNEVETVISREDHGGGAVSNGVDVVKVLGVLIDDRLELDDACCSCS